MTSRERVLTTLQHKEPDKVPIDFGGTRGTGIMAIAYNALKKYLNISQGRTRMFDWVQQISEVEPPLLQRFEVDIIDLENSSLRPDWRNWRTWTLPDGSPCEIPSDFVPHPKNGGYVVYDALGHTIATMPAESLYFHSSYSPWSTAQSDRELDNYPLSEWRDEELDQWSDRAKFLNKKTDYALVGDFGGSILETALRLRGWENFMTDILTHRTFAETIIQKISSAHLTNIKKYLDAVGDNIQIIQLNDDLGTQQAPQLSPDLYREIIYPYHKELIQYIKRHSKLHVMFHSCGAVSDFIPDFINAGIDILTPVQTSASGMNPADLKKKYGDKLVFWGAGCDIPQMMSDTTTPQIEQYIHDRLRTLAPGGGYIFSQTHNIQANVPPENIIAMFDSALKFRTYPIA